jgi:hypothetical protein
MAGTIDPLPLPVSSILEVELFRAAWHAKHGPKISPYFHVAGG